LFTSLLSPKFTRIPYTTLFRSDFIHGSSITFLQSGSRPIGTNPIPSDVPLWGPEFKKASIENFTKSLSVFGQGASLPQKQRVISLDCTYKDIYGLPLFKMIYNFTDIDRHLHKHITGNIEDIIKEMNANNDVGSR